MALGLVAGGSGGISMSNLGVDYEVWVSMKARYAMSDMYLLAWNDSLAPGEAEIFWQFGAGIEFKVWCARRFLAELKGILEGLKR